MDKQNLMPQASQPVNRITTGQLPLELAQLSEEALSQLGEATADMLLPSNYQCICPSYTGCSYDGDDAE